MKTVILFDHGINTKRGRGPTIAERFETFVAFRRKNRNTVVITDQYAAGPFPRFNMLIRNQWLARARFGILKYWHERDPATRFCLIGHSNGCDIARRIAILAEAEGIAINTIIFVAAPLKPSIEAMRLDSGAGRGLVVSNWVMTADEVLHAPQAKLGALIRWPYSNVGKIGLIDAEENVVGYGSPQPETRIYNRIFPWAHSEAFSNRNHEKTFCVLLKEAQGRQFAAKPEPKN